MTQNLFETFWQTKFGRFREEIDEVTAALLNRVHDAPCLDRDKFIHDPLWGNLRFSPAEMLIIDSPLVQRLRGIHQLGLASTLYPGAIHTRFEHTLGVTHLAGRIASRLRENGGNADPFHEYLAQERDNITLGNNSINVVQVVRIAALFHDTGHFFFSHAGEKALMDVRMGCSKTIGDELYKTKKGNLPRKAPLAELFSALIITSKSVQPLLSRVCAALQGQSDPVRGIVSKTLASTAAFFILGYAPTSRLTPYAHILSGTIDADKCDYLKRDSSYSGVPVAVDIDRIVDKLTSIPMKLEQGVDMGPFFEFPSDGHCDTLAIEHSAARNIDDMLISRSLMYEKVYFHHKVLTAEQLFAYGLGRLEKACPQFFANVGRLLELTDADFVGQPEIPGIAAFIERHDLSIVNKEAYREAQKIFLYLMYRIFYKRCSILSVSVLSPVPRDEGLMQEDVNQFLGDYVSDAVDREKPLEFTEAIAGELKTIIHHLGLEDRLPEEYKICGIQLAPYGKSAISNVTFPVAMNKNTGKKYNQIFNIESWQDGRLKQIAQHLILAPGSLTTEANLAVEMVLYRQHHLLLSSSVRDVCKIADKDFRDKKKKLAKAGYYDAVPQLIDVEDMLKDEQDRIAQILTKFASYQPGSLADEQQGSGSPINKQSLCSFIAQITPFCSGSDLKKMYQAMVLVLNKLECLTPSLVANKIRGSLNCAEIPESHLIIFPLGNQGDSATHLAYYIKNKLEKKFDMWDMGALQNFLDDGRPFVFYDDAFYSGSQVYDIFNSLLNGTPNKHVSLSLSRDEVDKLRAKKIYIVYGYGKTDNLRELKSKLEGLGLQIANVYCEPRESKPLFANERYDSEYWPYIEKLRKLFMDIGEQLLRPNIKAHPEEWDEERVENSRLGYGNAEEGIIYQWNTPTCTVTALWKGGEVTHDNKTIQWMPLFPRDLKSTDRKTD